MKSNDSNGINKLLLASIFFIIGMICFYILQTNQLLPSIFLKEKDEKIEVYKIEDTYVKPRVVYHGSPNKDLLVIEPQKGSVRDEHEGPVIFTSPNIGFASIFMSQHDDSWTGSGDFGSEHFYFFCKDKERFIKEDQGGAIYVLPSDGFTSRSNIGMRGAEWTSPNTTKPLYKFKFDSTLEAMMDLGIQVYFMSELDFNKFYAAIDYCERVEVLKNLKSENELQGKVKLNIFRRCSIEGSNQNSISQIYHC